MGSLTRIGRHEAVVVIENAIEQFNSGREPSEQMRVAWQDFEKMEGDAGEDREFRLGVVNCWETEFRLVIYPSAAFDSRINWLSIWLPFPPQALPRINKTVVDIHEWGGPIKAMFTTGLIIPNGPISVYGVEIGLPIDGLTWRVFSEAVKGLLGIATDCSSCSRQSASLQRYRRPTGIFTTHSDLSSPLKSVHVGRALI